LHDPDFASALGENAAKHLCKRLVLDQYLSATGAFYAKIIDCYCDVNRPMESFLSNNAFRGYDMHYARMRNTVPDWEAAIKRPEISASRKPWLPSRKDASILDFGCGWGHQLLSLWCAGYRNLEGVELSPEQARIAQCSSANRIPIACIDGRLFLRDRLRHYDCIILNDVLEHIPPTEAILLLDSVRLALKSGGQVVVRVPNMSSLLATYSRYMDITHVTGYTEWSLMQLLDLTGFTEHRLVEVPTPWLTPSFRPWAPWRGLGLRHRANLAIHRILYRLRCQHPMPKCVEYNLEIYSRKQAD
jgi:2-polyprenyl-3-methyl-5-hydroxy-6-metoxy-1,4-benzoquinol methylase